MNKNSNDRNRDKRESLQSLNSELGAFGLEPPKIYRNEQREGQRRAAKSGAPQHKTLQEKRREQNNRRKRSKLKRKIIFGTALGAAIAAVIVVLSLTVFFKISTIQVTGNKIYEAKEITAVLPIEKNSTNLFLMDKQAAVNKLYENLPYVYKAEIRRRFPSTIVVNITETPVIYSFKNHDKTYTLTDDQFKVLEVNAKKKKKGSITVEKATLKRAEVGKIAEFTDGKIKKNLLKLTEAVSKLELEKITSICSTDINNNYMVYDKRITYKLGNLDKLEKKIYSALAATEQLNETNPQAEGTLTIGSDNQIYFTEN